MTTSAFASDVKPPAPTSPYDFSPLSEKIQGWVDKKYYPGASVLVYKNGHVIYERYFGTYKPETVVYIASAGKWLAAATIAAVVDEGKLSWDDPVAKWIPKMNGVKGQATLRQLLSHTSGFPPYQPPGRHPDNYQTLRESVEQIITLPALARPGTRFQYGGLAMQVAGRMAELAAGKDWESLFSEKIARPLKMTDTHFTPVDQGIGRNPMLGGGARSTLQDYGNFLAMIDDKGEFAGNRVLSAESIREMEADQVGEAVVQREKELPGKVRGATHRGVYGLGEWREQVDSKGNAILISSPSWAGTYPWIDKTYHVFGILLAYVNMEQASKDQFNAFFESPVVATLVRQVLDVSATPRAILK